MRQDRRMRVATWNVNGLRARLGFVLHWLQERQPDVVGLQELKLVDDHFPHSELEQLGYRAVTYGQRSWNGVAILSRLPLEAVQKGLPGAEDLGARLLTAKAGDLLFSSIYCPNGKDVQHADFPMKLAWLDALGDHLEQVHRTDEALILGGDFNVCPAALDSWNEKELSGHIFHTEAERRRFQRLLDWGLSDVYRKLFPDTQAFSWWDYRAGAFHKKQGLRIDFLLATARVMKRVRAVEIDREYRKKKDGLIPSDHAPVFLDME
jgi:exodeoxyribonuclease-3